MKELNLKQMFIGSVNRISHVYRYSSIPTIRRENVAEHSWYVSFYSLLIAKDLIKHGVDVDMGLLLSRAMLHDLDESHTGDFLRIVKYGHPGLKSALDEMSITFIQDMSSELGVDLRNEWENAKAFDIEGDIIKIADLARVVSYVYEEILLGNSHIKHIIKEVLSYYESPLNLSSSFIEEYVAEIIKILKEFNDVL